MPKLQPCQYQLSAQSQVLFKNKEIYHHGNAADNIGMPFKQAEQFHGIIIHERTSDRNGCESVAGLPQSRCTLRPRLCIEM